MKVKYNIIAVVVIVAIILVSMNSCNKLFCKEENEGIKELYSHAKENGYSEFVEYMKNDLNEEECEAIITLLNGEDINQGMYTLKYTVMSADSNYCYINGIYTIPYNIRRIVIWASNISVDKYNENYYCNRHYTVVNPDEEAYLLIYGVDFGYQLIHIIPDDCDKQTSEIDYTYDGFNNILSTLNSKDSNLLMSFGNNPVITDELLDSLYENEDNYKQLYNYAKNLTGEDYEKVMNLFNSGEVEDSIETIHIGQNYQGNYWKYEDGVYTLDITYHVSVEWSQNIKEMEDDEQECKYVIVNFEEDAYIFFVGQFGYKLFCFVQD